MTFSIVMPSVAAAHKGSQEASGNASQVSVQSENADEDADKPEKSVGKQDADKPEKSSGKQDAEEDAPKDEGKSKSGDAGKDDEKEKADEKSGSDEDAGDKTDDSPGDKSGKEDAPSRDVSSDEGKKDGEPSDGSSRDVDADEDEDEQPDDSGEKSAREQEQGPVLRELRASLKCVDGVTYTVTVAYPEEAELPEGTELSLVELNRALTKKEQKLPENKHRPYKTEKFLSKDALEQVSFDLHSGLKVEEDDFVLFTKLLDLSLTHKGKAVQPKVPVQVTIETDVVSEGASDILEAALYDAKATEKWQKDLKERRKKAKERLPDTIFTRVKLENETRKKKGVKLRFETEEFARLGLTGVAKPLKSWDCQGETVRVYGPRHLKAEVRSANIETPEAGVEKLRAFTVKVTEKQRPDYDVKFWVGREQSSDGLSAQESADERVGVAARKLSGGKSKRDLFSAEDAGTPTAFREGDDIGLVWDTGFRDQTLEAEGVTLSGLLPKGAKAEADDVSGQYSDPGKVKKNPSGDKMKTLAAYDITIKDGKADFQPGEGQSVEVAIQNKGISGKKKLEVWHLRDDGSVEQVSSFTVKGHTIRFPARGFSVYLIVENVTSLCTYTFYSYNDSGSRIEYMFETEEGDTTSSVTIKGGEKLTAPQNPVHPKDAEATFVGWYAEDTESSEQPASDGTPPLVSQRFDFDHPNPPAGVSSVRLYAKFSQLMTVRFHGYYASAGSFDSPVIRTVTLPSQNGQSIQLKDYQTGYSDAQGNNAFPAYEFYGWTDADTAPAAGTIPASGKIPDGAEDSYQLTKSSTDLYPLFKAVRWLTPVSGNAGTSAKYFPPFSFQADSGPTNLSAYIPDRPGYDFQGWYLDVEYEGKDSQNGKGPQLTDENGSFLADFDNTQGAAYGVQVTSGRLFLDDTRDNVRIYAKWAPKTEPVPYSIVVWRQLSTDAAGLPEEQRHYECADSFTLTGTVDTDVTVAGDYLTLNQDASYSALHPGSSGANPYTNYTFNSGKSEVGPKSIKPKGNRVFNLYYDYSGAATTPAGSYTLRFLSLYNGAALSAEPVMLASTSLAPGAAISGHAAPTKPDTVPTGCDASIWPDGYDFYWYVDKTCSTRVFFDEDAEYQNYDESKVLCKTMPGHNLDLYGRWSKKRFRVLIDPNHGSLATESGGSVTGTGSTWFNVDYGERIEEYTYVTREYVPSSSGSYYFVNHDKAYADSIPNYKGDRYTYYTSDLSKATELTTYAKDPDVYSGVGWYEVVNGQEQEQAYDFSTPVQKDTILRMRWKRAGTYYLEYNAETVLNGKTLKGTVINVTDQQREQVYSDQAVLFLTGQANPPEGYDFIGWHVRGDESDTLWYPGTDFTLPAEYAVSVNGRQKVYLDAVYSRVTRAKIVYNANGGTIDADSVDFGAPADPNAPEVKTSVYRPGTGETGDETATISNLVNNSEIRLSSGAGFSCKDPVTGADLTLVGWYQLKEDGTRDDYTLNETRTLYVDTSEPVTLYANWQVTVTFVKPEGTAWSGDWSGYGEDTSGNKTLVTSLHATLDEPRGTVVPTAAADNGVFDFWCKTNDGDYNNVFSFGSEQLTGSLTLYASMTTAAMVPFSVLEQSGPAYLSKDESWRPTPDLRVQPNQALDLTSGDSVKSYLTISNPDEYTFVAAYVGTDTIPAQFDDSAKITAVKNVSGTVMVTQGGSDTALGTGKIYLVYRSKNPLTSKDVKIVYVKESVGGSLSSIQGSGGVITYNGEAVTMNGAAVAQNQTVTVTGDGYRFSQDGTDFHVPPLLDDGTNALDLVYTSIGVGNANAGSIFALGEAVSNRKKLSLNIEDNRLKWRFDEGSSWSDFTANDPTVYIIYQERGYDLLVKKTVTGEDTGIDASRSFTVTIRSDAIIRERYEVSDIGYTSVPATPAANGAPGSIVLSLRGNDSILIQGLGKGSYTIEETLPDQSFVMKAKVNGSDMPGDNPQIVVALPDTDPAIPRVQVELINQPQYICQVPYGTAEPKKFYTLNRALAYAEEKLEGAPATIQMLMDYEIPSSDALTIPEGYDITLTSASATETYTIKRAPAFESGAMFTNHGTLTLDRIVLDGGSDGSKVAANAATVWTDSILTVKADAVLQNAYSSKNGGAIYATGTEENPGELNLYGRFEGNRAVRGGAVYAVSGAVNITGGRFTNNKAGSGGAVYYGSNGDITLNGGSFTGNMALTGNGGGIYAVGGTIDLSNSTNLSGNSAQAGSGGAIYAENAVITLSDNSAISGNSAKNGGGIYAQAGEITMSGTMSGNKALNGSGGGVYLDRGQFTMSTGTMTKNEATSRGGAVYTNAGDLFLSGGTIGGGSDTSNANSAQNGSAIFLNTGEAQISNITITKNKTSDANKLTAGGAVGVGTESARLYFTGTPVVKDNNQMDKESGSGTTYRNVYLDQDSEIIFNATDLSGNLEIGVYVPGAFEETLFQNRGTVCARFGIYETLVRNNVKSRIKNDRLTNVETDLDTATYRLYWSRPFKVEARTLDSYGNTLPPQNEGTSLSLNGGEWYNPPASKNAASNIAEDVVEKKSLSGSIGTRTFNSAFVKTNANGSFGTFNDYVKELNWDDDKGKWVAVLRSGAKKPLDTDNSKVDTLRLYYSNPAYLSIENNSAYDLTINDFKVSVAGSDRTAINSATQTGFGYVVSIDGETQSALLPIEQASFPAGKKVSVNDAGKLVLQAGGTVKLAFPCAQGQKYTLEGSFNGTEHTQIPCTLNQGTAYNEVYADTGISLTGNDKKLRSDADTYEIILNGKKPICKIVAPSVIDGTDALNPRSRSDGKVEYLFTTLTAAQSFATTYQPTSQIEMLTDYPVSTADHLVIPKDSDITITTAVDGIGEQYPRLTGVTDESKQRARRATLSRDAGYLDPLIKMEIGKTDVGRLTIHQVNFDGKNLGGTNDYGIIKAKNANVVITDVRFNNCKAKAGGGIYIDYDETYAGDYILDVERCDFVGCHSTTGTQRIVGGGAIWTCAKEFYLYDCTFQNCTAADQGGAVFHRIDAQKTGNGKTSVFSYAAESKSDIRNCSFINCIAQAAGGLESEAFDFRMSNCTFNNCKATNRNAGAVNVYIYEDDYNTDRINAPGSKATFTSCTFNNCSCGKRGGGIRCTALSLYVNDCSFKNCTGKEIGGAICVLNEHAQELVIKGTTIDTCSGGNGGAVYCAAPVLKLEDYTYPEGTAPRDRNVGRYNSSYTVRYNEIKNCVSNASEGGAICHKKKYNQNVAGQEGLTIDSADSLISGNKTLANGKSGGGIYTDAWNVLVKGCTIQNNTCTSSGGGICHNGDSANYRLTIDHCTIKGNAASAYGGGVYTNSQLTLRNDTMVTENRLTSTDKKRAAGVYIKETDRTLTVGDAGKTAADPNYVDNTSVVGNYLSSGEPSNQVLWWNSNTNPKNENNKASVEVLSNLGGEIRVIRAAKKGTIFGKATCKQGDKFSGFSILGKDVFIADDGSLYGVYNRLQDFSGDQANDDCEIIWRGDVICKFTDEAGNLLYLDSEGYEPAIFDRLDYATDGSMASAFSYLRQELPELYLKNPDDTLTPFDVNTTKFCLKLLVETIQPADQNNGNNFTGEYPARDMVLTTAGRMDEDFPYTGRVNTSSVIKGSSNKTVLSARSNVTLNNVILDGTGTTNSRGIISDPASADKHVEIRLEKGAIVREFRCNGDGGGVYLKNSSLVINGGSIYNCTGRNGGGVYHNYKGSVTLQAGTISNCKATGTGSNGLGGGIYYQATNDDWLTMSGGLINGCEAQKGGGIYVAGSRILEMTGGTITANSATANGGGIATGDNAQLHFSRVVTVSGNKMGGKSCNVQLDYDKNSIIYSYSSKYKDKNGDDLVLDRGSYVGVYCPGNYVPLTDADREAGKTHNDADDGIYKKHGGEKDPFGTWNQSNNTETNIKRYKYLYCFVNDRNGLKGGLQYGDTMTTGQTNTNIYWIKIYSLKISKQVLSDLPSEMNDDEFTFKVTFYTDAGGTYKEVTNEFDLLYSFKEDQDTIRSGQQKTLRNEQYMTVDNLPTNIDGAPLKYKVEELKTSNMYYSGTDKLKYTTTTYNSTGTSHPYYVQGTIGDGSGNPLANEYLSVAAFANQKAIVKLTYNGRLLYYWKDNRYVPAVYSRLYLAFDQLNGASAEHPLYYWDSYRGTYEKYDGTESCNTEMLIPDYTMTKAVALDGDKTTVMTTAKWDATDGYPYVGEANTSCEITRGNDSTFNSKSMFTANGDLTMKNIRLNGNGENVTASADGGIVKVPEDGSLTLTDGAVLNHSKTSGKGAGVYVASGGTVHLKGDFTFGGTDRYEEGDTIPSGKSVGDLRNESGNFCTNAANMSGAQNGGKSYTLAHQDIYLEENHPGAPASIILESNLDGDDGSIWVWAEKAPHHKELMPFAKLANGVNGGNLKVFRNAQPDQVSDNGTGDWLHGTSAEELGETEGYVYWNGVRGNYRVILRKVNGVHAPLPGATMTVYRKGGVTVYQYKDENGQTKKLENLTTDNSGVYWIGMLPYGEYWVHERKLNGADKDWWFVLTVDASGATCSERQNTKPTTT